MTLRVKVAMKITCPRHRGYDPATQGEAGIRGGCSLCYQLLGVHNSAIAFALFVETVKRHAIRVGEEKS